MLTLARRAWPAVTVLAVIGNLVALPEYTRSLLTRTVRAELPAAHLAPAGYVAIEVRIAAVFTLVCLAVATVIYVRAAREPVALFCAYTLMALGLGIGGFLPGLAITNPVANALSVIVTAVAQVLGGWFFLVFPSGRFVPRWSRWCVLAAAVGIAIVTVPAIARGQPAPDAGQPAIPGCSCSESAQFYRYRRVSTLAERQQTKWVVFGLAAGTAVIVAGQLVHLLLVQVIPSVVKSQAAGNLAGGSIFILAVAFIRVCVGIAVLRAHRWDIGLVISRTLTYAVVTALVVGVYTGLVLLATRVLPFRTAVAVAGSTLAAATIVNPLRSWLWRPRRMNWPVTASSRHSSTAVTADWTGGCPVRPTATASAAVIAPEASAAGAAAA